MSKKFIRNLLNIIILVVIDLQQMFYYLNWDNAIYGYPTHNNLGLEYFDTMNCIWFFLLLGWFFWTILVWNGLNNGVKALRELFK